MSRRVSVVLFAVLALGCFAACTQATAQAVRTIRVTGSGTASVSPNFVELRGTVRASGDTVEEATESFKKEKEKVDKAIGGNPALKVDFAGEKLVSGAGGAGGLAVPVAALGGAAPAAAKSFSLSEEVVVRMEIDSDMQRAGIVKQFSGVIDGATKAGVQFGGGASGIYAQMGLGIKSGIVQFGHTKESQEQLRTKAYAAAFNDARSRAAALAKLSGGQVGKVVSVEEVAAPEGASGIESMQMNMLARMFGGQSGGAANTIDHNGLIELQQEIVVTFELVE